MPITKSATKAHRQSLTKRSRNKHFLALYKESLKAFQKGVAAGLENVNDLLSNLQSSIDTLVKKNILHGNTAARRKSSAAKYLVRGGVAISTKTPKASKAKAKPAPVAKVEAVVEAPAKKVAAKKPAAKAEKTEAKKASAKKAK